jgi:hypothetical protein
VFIHEIGHLVVLLCCGFTVTKFIIGPRSGRIVFNGVSHPPVQYLLTSFAGSLAEICIIIVILLFLLKKRKVRLGFYIFLISIFTVLLFYEFMNWVYIIKSTTGDFKVIDKYVSILNKRRTLILWTGIFSVSWVLVFGFFLLKMVLTSKVIEERYKEGSYTNFASLK